MAQRLRAKAGEKKRNHKYAAPRFIFYLDATRYFLSVTVSPAFLTRNGTTKIAR